MPVDQAPSQSPARSRSDTKIVQYHDFIDAKIDSTRRMVKVVDLTTALVELFVAVLLFLLLSVVAEHWLVPGGLPSAVRVVLFVVLVAGCGYFAVRRLWPLCVRAINPVYAAQTIEHGTPTLKNGLINLLLFRDRRAEISDAVYHTLEEQAVHGLARAPIDTAVDRTELIRLGYVLIGIVAVAGLYKVFSPKDPFVAAERMLMPWSNILPASRVTIADIQPGTETVSQGEVVEVSAEVHGLNDDDTVMLRYSTEDGQIAGRAIPLKVSADKLRFQAKLAEGGERALSSGVTRNLKYRLEAGDAHSLTYSITVVPAATILVERVDYHYPKYTGLVDQSVDGIGDIRAIEGTRVTIHARANGAIREANVDFDADGRPDLQMTTEDAKAHAEFALGLRDDRQTPQHASYVLRFANAEGRANHDPVKYSINVDPDRSPEAEIRLPLEKSRDARLDETVNIEIEARDPDFALSAVRLRGQVAGRDVLTEPLLKEEHRGPFDGRFAMAPAARGLKEGDVLEYWAEADDNRTPKPNTVATEHKTLRIVSANAAQQPQDRKNDRQQRRDGGQGQKNQDQKGEQNQKNEQGKSGDQKSGGEGGQGQQQNQGGQGQQGQGQGDKQQGDKSQSGQSNGDQQSGGGDQSKQSSGLKQNQTGSGGGDKSNQHDGLGQSGQEGGQSVSNDPSSKKPDQQGQNKQTGAGAAGGESSKDGAQPDGTRPDANKSEKENSAGGKSNSGEQKNGEPQNVQQPKGQKGDAQSGESQSPVSSEGDDDAEAFNRIQKRMEKSGDLKPGESESSKKQGGSQGDQGQKKQDKGTETQNPNDGQQGQAGGEKKEMSDGQNAKSQLKDGASSNGGSQKDSNSQQQQGVGSKPEEKDPGAQSQQDGSKQQGQQGDGAQQKQSSGEGQSTSKGTGGSGNEQKKQGAPDSQQGMKPTEKPEQAGSKNGNKSDKEPPAGASGKKESDSHGDQGGDKAGGGSEGSGQKSPHDGTGSTGQNQSADTGNGQSGEQGKGDTSNASGKDAKSDHATGGGSDGKTQGKGSEQRDGAGDKAGGKAGDQQGAGGNQSKQDQAGQNGEGMKQSPGDKQGQKQDGNKSESKGTDQQAGKNGKASEKPSDQKSDQQQNGKDGGSNAQSGSGGGGEPGGAVDPQVSITGEAPEGDSANLEYARKQTDLVVGKLADQLNRKQVDKDLLKELGWSEADLKRFVDRWQQRKVAADQNNEAGDAAKRDLDDALRSLGLRSGELQQSAVQKDSMRDLHEGYRGPVPAEYKDRLRAYNQGVSRAKRDGE